MGRPSVHHQIIGQRFGRLTVAEVVQHRGRAALRCTCDCGGETVTRAVRLRAGTATSCGCYRREKATIHGHTPRDAHDPTYAIWNAMIARCCRPNTKNFHRYGGRGITVDPQWMTYAGFLADMGPKPQGLMLERSDNDKGYTKSNCRWATRAEQNNNKSNNRFIEHAGKRQTLSQWAREIGISPATILKRLDAYGWPVERALTPELWKRAA